MLLQKVQNHININFPELLNSSLLLAVSGGVDSMVMLDILNKLNFNITVAHCNFKLRGIESDEETFFLKAYLKEHNIKHEIIFFDTENYAKINKLSIQLAARELRYNWFDNLLVQLNLNFTITAHHLDDQAETFLINFTRGTGLDGLLGIPSKNNNIIRPFLTCSRDEILKYAQQNNVPWREDSSNLSSKYFRNKIRHKVIPILKELNPDFLKTFVHTLENLNDYKHGFDDGFSYIKKDIVSKTNSEYYINIEKLKKLKSSKSFLYRFLIDYNFTAWKDIYKLVDSSSGKMIKSNSHILLKDREFLILKSIEQKITDIFEIHSLDDLKNLPINIKFNEVIIDKNDLNIVEFDNEKLKFPLKLRKWIEGDYFYPKGMSGKKKISKYFKDEKFSQFQKDNCWLLTQATNEIIWIVGYRADKRFLTNINTINSIQLQFTK